MSPHWEIGTARDGFEPVAPRTLAAVARLDPYIVWAHATQYRDLGGAPLGRIPIAIEMKEGGDSARRFAQTIERNGWQSWIWMSALYRDPPPALEATRFCTAHVTREFYANVNTKLAGKFERFTEALAIASHADAPSHPSSERSARMDAQPGSAIVGVCDEDIAFTHARFAEDAAGTRTRFLCFWNQNDAADTAASLGYGSELFKDQIDALLNPPIEAMQAGNGARVYRIAHERERNADRDESRESPAPMIGVQLKKRCSAMRDAFGPCLDAELLDAVRYIVQRGHEISGAACHALVSIAAGNAAWQQDGSSLIESALDELMDTGACSIVLPSGNIELAGARRALTIAQRAVTELRWPVRANASSPSLAEIWFSNDGAAPSVDVQIVPPGGVASAWLTLGDVGVYTRGGETICTVVHLGRGARGDGHMVLIALAPTSARRGLARAAAGDWLVRLRNNASSEVRAYASMQRDAAASWD